MADDRRILDEIGCAKELYHSICQIECFIDYIKSPLVIYRNQILLNSRLNEDLGVKDDCRKCYQRDGNSCCFEGAEKYYDRFNLLQNIIFGVSLPEQREISCGCWFLGVQGCKLIAKCSICINFICPAIVSSLAVSDHKWLKKQTGAEVLAGLESEKYLVAELARISLLKH